MIPRLDTVMIGLVAHRYQTFAGLSLSLGAGSARLRDYPFTATHYVASSNAIVDEARNLLLERAISLGRNWLIMLDDDVSFSPDTLGELLSMARAHENCVVAGLPAKRADNTDTAQPSLNVPGFAEVRRVGGAGMCISIDRLLARKLMRPWFVSQPRPDGLPYGEDYYFCDNVVRSGGSVYCHHKYWLSHDTARVRAADEINCEPQLVSGARQAVRGGH